MTALIHAKPVPPMPATNCPDWCQAEHYDEWLQLVNVLRDPTPIPAQGGGFLPMSRPHTDEYIADTFVRDLCHNRPLYGSETVGVDLVQYPDDSIPRLMMDVRGELTAEQARTLSDVLGAASERLERLQAQLD